MPGQCPECGLGFRAGYSGIEIAGVAKQTGGPAWRRSVWIVLAICAFLYSQVAVYLLVRGLGWYALVGLLAISAGVIAMAVTNRQKKTGTEIFTITADGFGRRSARGVTNQTDFACWQGDPVYKVERVSRVWSKIKVGVVDSTGSQTKVLDAGFRCPDADLEILHRLLKQQADGKDFDDLDQIDGIENSIFMNCS